MSAPSLLDILSYRRPANSESEDDFIRRFIVPTGAEPDLYGNYILRIGSAPVLWSAHTDTVHRTSGRQTLDLRHGLIRLHPTEFTGQVFRNKGKPVGVSKYYRFHQTCLGADDGTGVWLLLHMIRAGVPGLYVFHREEECGAIGSTYIARHTPSLLDGIKYAIAFDRRGEDSVVTFQGGLRTASDLFASELADRLRLDMKPDDTGIFTDTQSYADIIPECTNVSVGYHNAHSEDELQDVNFACDLLDAMLHLDLDLPVDRDPLDTDSLWKSYKEDDWGEEYWKKRYGSPKKHWYDDDLERCDACYDWMPAYEVREWSRGYMICDECIELLAKINESKHAQTG